MHEGLYFSIATLPISKQFWHLASSPSSLSPLASSFMFAICHRPSVCLSSVVCRLSVTFVHHTQPIKIVGNVSAPFNTMVT